MIDNKNIYAAVEVLNEFKDKLKVLCEEYRDKVREVCPEDINSKYIRMDHEIDKFDLNHLQFDGRKGEITKKELEDNGFLFNHRDDGTSFYTKSVCGINVHYSIDAEEAQNET